MKAITIIIGLILTVNGFGQSVRWNPSKDISKMVADDTVIYPKRVQVRDVANHYTSVTVWSTDLDTSIRFSVGGSNKYIKGDVFGFEAISNDSLPYRFYYPDHLTVTNGDTTYQKTITFSDPLRFTRPGLWISKDSASTGTVNFEFLFTQP